jgi:glutathione S-transferase
MELPYVLRNAGRLHWRDWVLPVVRERFNISGESEQRNRQYLHEHHERVTIPFLEDPNTGAAMGDSEAILSYLRGTYGQC